MSSRSLNVVAAVLLFAACAAAQPLKVCADPNNPPFSSRQQTGFENKIAAIVARQMNMPVAFYWTRMGRGFVRDVMNRGFCDVVISVPQGMRGMDVSVPYFRSSYVFVTRATDAAISSFDDPQLAHKKIGVQILDDDYAPPARALGRRSLGNNIVGFEMESHAGEIVRAVATKKIDTAVIWGPLAAYYARQFGTKLRLTPVTPAFDGPVPFAYEMGVGVRKNDRVLLEKIDRALIAAHPAIERVLASYNVPLLPLGQKSEAKAGE